jgi:hypothetical protein
LDVEPVQVCLPAASGYTLRRHHDDPDHERPVFLGRGKTVFAFRSTANLVAFLRSGEAHDLADLPSWEEPDWDRVSLVEDIGLTYNQVDVCRLDFVAETLRRRKSTVDLDGAETFYDIAAILDSPPFAEVLGYLRTHEVAGELAEYAGLAEVLDALALESPLGAFELDLQRRYFSKSGNRQRLSSYDMSELADRWLKIVPQIVSVVQFRD